jgi:protein required for attachment to host cells
MKPEIEWILVMNATRARLIRGLPESGEPAAPELVLRAPSHHLREVMSDKPGRSFSSGSPGRRSAMDYGSDPLRQDELEFVRQVIALIESHRRAGDFDRLAIVAAPHTLGLLREEMPHALQPLVSRELAKNLAGVLETALPGVLKRELGAA